MLRGVLLIYILILASDCQERDESDMILMYNKQDEGGDILINVDDTDQIMLQAEQLFQDENPLIEQMLQLAQGLGGDGDDTKMLLMLEDAKDQEIDILIDEIRYAEENPMDAVLLQIDYLINTEEGEDDLLSASIQNIDGTITKSDNVPDYAILQSPQSDSKIVQNEQQKSLRIIIEDESQGFMSATKVQDVIVQCEFIIGAMLVFFSVTMLWKIEARLYRRDTIKMSMEEFLQKQLIAQVKGIVDTRECITDEQIGIQVINCLRLYRKVEKYDLKIWNEIIEPNSSKDIFSSRKQSLLTIKLDRLILDEGQISRMNHWEPLSISNLRNKLSIVLKSQDSKYLYVNNDLRISYFIIPCSQLTVISGITDNLITPRFIHFPKYEWNVEEDQCGQYCDKEICHAVRQWIEWGEWDDRHDQINIIQTGDKSIKQMVSSQLHQMTFGPKLSRILVFIILCLGVQLFFLPIFQVFLLIILANKVLKLFPIFGALVDHIGAWIGTIVGILFASVFCLTTTGISFCLYKPKKGFFLLSTATTICLVLIACTHLNYQINPQEILKNFA